MTYVACRSCVPATTLSNSLLHAQQVFNHPCIIQWEVFNEGDMVVCMCKLLCHEH